MNTERLERLAQHLDTLAWRHHCVNDSRREERIFSLATWGYKTQCGFIACAGGEAARMIPEFQEAGLATFSEFNFAPLFNGMSGIPALASFFDIYQSDARRLFLHSYYSWDEMRQPAAVARRIRQLIAGGDMF